MVAASIDVVREYDKANITYCCSTILDESGDAARKPSECESGPRAVGTRGPTEAVGARRDIGKLEEIVSSAEYSIYSCRVELSSSSDTRNNSWANTLVLRIYNEVPKWRELYSCTDGSLAEDCSDGVLALETIGDYSRTSRTELRKSGISRRYTLAVRLAEVTVVHVTPSTTSARKGTYTRT